MAQNEASIAELIHDYLRTRAHRDSVRFSPFPLGGQDRHFLSDSLLGRVDHFCLIEMKFGEAQLQSEAKKRRRVEALCRALEREPEMRALHDQCHFIAWMDKTKHVRASAYRDRICNKEVLGSSCGLTQNVPDLGSTVSLNSFADGFLGHPPTKCLSKEDFKRYINWLHNVVTGTPIIRLDLYGRAVDGNGEVVAFPLTSIDEVHGWFLRQ
ncbi:hypothetical protein [Paraburkholderia kirstenboschensis]|uniref:Uncharacterized protein n=1 Tax=Paraburkholderia kirstenboschensis TaxID=1245436 RepID=A0ABZ0EMI2_9BURK|nr:hypothetical protein [Paraburkholderia kirstenboschensis]WOD18150.1 hypothetical protein RW095_35900 [Paraburkholderia kirstenboschensis]